MALFVPAFAAAAGWSIDPVRVDLYATQQTAAITVGNDSAQPTAIQIQAVTWTQVEGKDVYTPTKEILVSPPIFTIAPKSEQVIRVALRRQADTASELTYRINLHELPSQPKPGFMGIQVALRVSLPVFVQRQDGKALAKMTWNVSRLPDNMLKVRLKNQGSAHVQVSDFSLLASGSDRQIAGEAGSSYVLAGQSREWLLKMNSSKKLTGGSLRLKAYTDAGNIDTELELDKP
jgi:fimbrial chaperone protein